MDAQKASVSLENHRFVSLIMFVVYACAAILFVVIVYKLTQIRDAADNRLPRDINDLKLDYLVKYVNVELSEEFKKIFDTPLLPLRDFGADHDIFRYSGVVRAEYIRQNYQKSLSSAINYAAHDDVILTSFDRSSHQFAGTAAAGFSQSIQ